MEALPTVPDEQQIGVVVILGLFICGYCAFFFLGRSEKIRKRLLDGLGPRAGAIHHITFQKLPLLWAIPLGAALCLLVLAAGTFWPAFFIHFSLSVGNTFGMILRRKPDVVFTTRRYDPDRSGAC